ncbi:hypothetical protein [Methanosphaera cuniculi]|uniref:Uncharacterized protein n=1 Tax=Methanosphaera cuniculi TaxID=1077256 RepID=A0A2V2BRB0_9EURY|nr:hypothetical protein [Methanosphaera cuniculi]PWL08630.1 hypothetical protein MSCUN_03430 [Methanosphaera cuniculi]
MSFIIIFGIIFCLILWIIIAIFFKDTYIKMIKDAIEKRREKKKNSKK